MASTGDITLPATRRPRKSLSNSPRRKGAQKENATVEIGSAMTAAHKKSRSKSMGPGGLDVLKTGNGNRRVSLAAPPRSILKPTMPLLPEIPPHKSKSKGKLSGRASDNNSDNGTRVAVRTEDEQQAAAREREARERAELEKEINDRREARRKSLANRRVSFAAEATLHNYQDEWVLDSTTSTDSTGRRSSAAPPGSAQQKPQAHVDEADVPSTLAARVEHQAASPASQRDLHENKHGQSSGAASLDCRTGDDDTLNTTIYSSDSEHADGVAEIQAEEMSSNADSDEEDGTMVTVEAEEITLASVASAPFDLTVSSTGELEDNLRLATQRATANRIEDDEEVIAGFVGWGKKKPDSQDLPQVDQVDSSPVRDVQPEHGHGDDEEMSMDMEMDMDTTKAVGGIIHNQPDVEEEQDDDMSMDVTRPLGGIISQPKQVSRRKSTRFQQPQAKERDDTGFGDAPMDFTMTVGGVRNGRTSDGSQADTEVNEDMSMELTVAVGGVLDAKFDQGRPPSRRRRTIQATADDEAPMEMTTAMGQIIPTETESDGGKNETVNMDMTMAMGGIIKSASPAARSAAKKIMKKEADEAESSITTSVEVEHALRESISGIAHETGTPGLAAFRGNGLRRSLAAGTTPTLKSPFKGLIGAADNKTSTPTSQDKTKTPVSMIGSRSKSTRKRSSPSKESPVSPLKAKTPEKSVFRQDPRTGSATPRVILTPQRRGLSGVGVDRPGLGSPRVTEILNRRESLGDAVTDFVSGKDNQSRRIVAFADPRAMEGEIDKERKEEEDKENSRRILEREADGAQDERDATLNLKELIQSLSPKKKDSKPMRGRKSLHVGSAKGLLGKRPAELDGDDDDDSLAEDRGGVKRLKGLQGSPVKNVHLQQPPSKAETTTGRKTRSNSGKSLGDSTAPMENITPSTRSSPTPARTPKEQGRFRNVEDDQPTTVNFTSSPTVNEVGLQVDDSEERIHLQDFLNLTSIRFMELTTTKRRHTVAPSAARDSIPADGLSLENCVVAGACTVPMLELYQHSCRELKKYISEGRRIVREIETETFEENPALFREYMTASPDFKTLMDNQFKNVKTHARLLSKAMWYEWRMKLQDGLKEGLLKTAEGFDSDDQLLQKQQDLIASILPAMLKHIESLEKQLEHLQAIAKELADCDPEDLEKARAELVAADKEIEEKTKKMATLRQQLQESETGIEALRHQKQQYEDEIKEAETIREECRGWSSTEIAALKDKVEALEREHGWAITGCQGTTLSMKYRGEVEMVFDAAAFRPENGNSSSNIDLRYMAAQRERDAQPQTPEKEFFLQCIRDHLRSMQPSTLRPRDVLATVSRSWDEAKAATRRMRLLAAVCPTVMARTSDASMAVRASLLLVPLRTKVDVVIDLHARLGGTQGLEVGAAARAAVVYGEPFNEAALTEFVASRMLSGVEWCDVVLGLQKKLLKGRQ